MYFKHKMLSKTKQNQKQKHYVNIKSFQQYSRQKYRAPLSSQTINIKNNIKNKNNNNYQRNNQSHHHLFTDENNKQYTDNEQCQNKQKKQTQLFLLQIQSYENKVRRNQDVFFNNCKSQNGNGNFYGNDENDENDENDDKKMFINYKSVEQFYQGSGLRQKIHCWKTFLMKDKNKKQLTKLGQNKIFLQLSSEVQYSYADSLVKKNNKCKNVKNSKFYQKVHEIFFPSQNLCQGKGSIRKQNSRIDFLKKVDLDSVTSRQCPDSLRNNVNVKHCMILNFNLHQMDKQNSLNHTIPLLQSFKQDLFCLLSVPIDVMMAPPKAHWSICGILQNKRYDLLSMKKDNNMANLWSAKATEQSGNKSLTKNIICKQNIFNRLIQFSIQKEKQIFLNDKETGKKKKPFQYQILIKVQYENKNCIYIVLKRHLQTKKQRQSNNCHHPSRKHSVHSVDSLKRQSYLFRSDDHNNRTSKQNCIVDVQPSRLLINQQIFHQGYVLFKQLTLIKVSAELNQVSSTFDIFKAYPKIPRVSEENFRSGVMEKQLMRIFETLVEQLEKNKVELKRYKGDKMEGSKNVEKVQNSPQSFLFDLSETRIAHQDSLRINLEEFDQNSDNQAPIPSQRASVKMRQYYSKFLNKSVGSSQSRTSSFLEGSSQQLNNSTSHMMNSLSNLQNTKFSRVKTYQSKNGSTPMKSSFCESSLKSSKIKQIFFANWKGKQNICKQFN